MLSLVILIIFMLSHFNIYFNVNIENINSIHIIILNYDYFIVFFYDLKIKNIHIEPKIL